MPVESNLMELTAVIVACFVSNNSMAPNEVPALISATHAALHDLEKGRAGLEREEQPAVPVEQSIAHDFIVCLNDGRKLRALKRYLKRKYGLSPEAYREKWGLPADYPMVAPGYSELRAKIAKMKGSGTFNLLRARRVDDG
jgi:predicted transcriptional regulator